MKNSKLTMMAAIIAIFFAIGYALFDKQPESLSPTSQVTGSKQNNAAASGNNNSFSINKPADINDPESIQYIAKGKVFLASKVDTRLKQMSIFISKVENTTGFDEAERKAVVAELNNEISEFVALKPEINESQTKEDVNKVAEEVKAVWLKSRASANKAQAQLANAQEKSILSEANKYSTGIKKRIEILKASGKSTKQYDELLANYNKKLTAAKQSSDQATEMFKTIDKAKTDEEKDKLKKEKDELLTNSHENVKDAYKALTDAAKQEFAQRYK